MAAARTLVPRALLAVAALAALASSSKAGKRGYVADGCTGASCQDLKLLASVDWYYAYNRE